MAGNSNTDVRERKKKGASKTSQKTNKDPASSSDKQEEQGGGGDASNTVASKEANTHQEKPVKKKNVNKEKTKQEKSSLLGSICSKARYLLLIIFIPPFLNYASLQKEATELKPPGEQYDIGWGQKLFLSCRGKGPPTVVLDAPTGMSSDVWTLVVDKLADHANVCTYDRAGLGYSDRPINRSVAEADPNTQLSTKSFEQWEPFTVERMVEDLYKLISSSSQQPRPLIFVGAELGAMVAQFFTLLYESDVLGLVLVNPLPEDLFLQTDDVWIQHWFGSLGPTYQTLQLGAALGITRLGLLIGALKQPITGESVPDDVILRQKYLMCHPRHLSSVVDEHHFINETFSQMRMLRKLRSLPSNISISVLTGNYYDEQMPSHLNKAWARAEQSLLSKLPSHVQHLVVNGADRHMMYRKPEPIIEAVLKIVRKWRRTQPLSGSQNA